MAKLQVEIFEEDEDQHHSIKRDQVPKDHLDYQLKQECKERQYAIMNTLSRVVHLPKPELQTLNVASFADVLVDSLFSQLTVC